jgi:RNA polymerase sigma factor FliA
MGLASTTPTPRHPTRTREAATDSHLHAIDDQAVLPPGVPDESAAWTRFHATRDGACRQYLVARYHRVVRAIAAKCARRLPAMIDLYDLVSVGLFGLMRAMESFEPSRGVKFQTYCGKHILGAIHDWLREVDWAPRTVRRSEALVRRAADRFRMRCGRTPTQGELVIELRCGHPDEKRDAELVVLDAKVINMSSLSQDRESSGHGFRTIEIIPDRSAPNAGEQTGRHMIRDLVTKGLDRERRLVLILYYYENLTMREIGLALGKSESRVSQMHAEVLDWLRTRLRDRKGELAPP